MITFSAFKPLKPLLPNYGPSTQQQSVLFSGASGRVTADQFDRRTPQSKIDGIQLVSAPTIDAFKGGLIKGPLVVLVPETKDFQEILQTDIFQDLQHLDAPPPAGWIKLLKERSFTGQLGKVEALPVYPRDRVSFPFRDIVFVGVGNLQTQTPFALNKVLLGVFRGEQLPKSNAVNILLPDTKTPADQAKLIQATTEALKEACYVDPNKFFAQNKDFRQTNLITPSHTDVDDPTLKAGLQQALSFYRGVKLAEDLANTPHSHMKTQDFVNAVRCMASAHRDVLSMQEFKDHDIKQNLPLLHAVGQAAASNPQKPESPAFIKLTYTPPPAREGETAQPPLRKIALVGKTVMYDDGGKQKKDAAGMLEMSRDMTGGANLVGLMKILAETKPAGVQVTAYLPVVSNLDGAAGYKPGDLIRHPSGKTIRVIDTDAEGRLVLFDGVYQAALDNPDEIITMATLTSSAVKQQEGGKRDALVLATEADALLSQQLMAAAQTTGEPFSARKVGPSYFDQIKAPRSFAEGILDNHTGKEFKDYPYDAQYAAAFVNSAIPAGKGIPFAQIDMCGIARNPDTLRAQGWGIRTLLEHILHPAA